MITRSLDPALASQTHFFMNAYRTLDTKRAAPRKDYVYDIVAYLLSCFVASREERLADIASPKVQKATKIKDELFPLGTPKLNICVDVRVNPKFIAGQHSSAFHTAAGDNDVEFLRAESGTLFLKEGKFSAMLDRAFKHTDTLVEILDSHLGCAARAKKSKHALGVLPADGGLADDVARKRAMCKAIDAYVARRWSENKTVHCVQISFDPHSGFLFMGLERCLDSRDEDGFTERVLDTLARNGSIISTRALVDKSIFERYAFPLDYPSRYQESTLTFWKHLQALITTEPRFFDTIQQHVVRVFPDESELLRRQRAVILLANTYAGYLHNQGTYPFGNHDESTIVVSHTDRGPYACVRPFQLDPQTPHLSPVIYFVEEIIRDNRAQNRVLLDEQKIRDTLFPSSTAVTEYARSPILVHIFQRISAMPHGDELSRLRAADWSDLPETQWMDRSYTDEQFQKDYLEKKCPHISAECVSAVFALRARARALHEDGDAAESFIEGNLILVSTLAGPNRETIALFPFMAKGYRAS